MKKISRLIPFTIAAPAVTQNGSMDFPGGSTSSLLTYNASGSLYSDASRKISSITYDNLGHPVEIKFSNGSCTKNVYSATGEKLSSEHSTSVTKQLSSTELLGLPETEMQSVEPAAVGPAAVIEMEYHGPVIYVDGEVDKVLFPGGYATISATGAVTFHYYTQDYLGNNRAVINGSTGAIEQTIAYYPYGGIIADLGTNLSAQQYKFGGKELTTANGLNEYDFGARSYYQAVPYFTSIDPMCEKYY